MAVFAQGILISRKPFFPHARRQKLPFIGSSHRFTGTMEMKIVSGQMNQSVFCPAPFLECSWRPRFRMWICFLPHLKRARDLKGKHKTDLERKDNFGKRKHASKKRTRKARCNKESMMQWTAIGINNQLCAYCTFVRCWGARVALAAQRHYRAALLSHICLGCTREV